MILNEYVQLICYLLVLIRVLFKRQKIMSIFIIGWGSNLGRHIRMYGIEYT